jgi:hypothetical protein
MERLAVSPDDDAHSLGPRVSYDELHFASVVIRQPERSNSMDIASNPWLDSLDALVAAASHHTLLMENDRVRVIQTLIPVGDTVPVHTHRWPAVMHVLSWSDFIRRDEHGKTLLDTRGQAPPPEGAILWSEPLPPHSVENVGSSPIRIIGIELKTP